MNCFKYITEEHMMKHLQMRVFHFYLFCQPNNNFLFCCYYLTPLTWEIVRCCFKRGFIIGIMCDDYILYQIHYILFSVLPLFSRAILAQFSISFLKFRSYFTTFSLWVATPFPGQPLAPGKNYFTIAVSVSLFFLSPLFSPSRFHSLSSITQYLNLLGPSLPAFPFPWQLVHFNLLFCAARPWRSNGPALYLLQCIAGNCCGVDSVKAFSC